MHLIGLDVETTGLDIATTSLTEVAMVHYNGRERIRELNIKIQNDSEKLINLGALKVTKQNINDIQDFERATPKEATYEIVNFILEAVKESKNKELKIIGHNVRGDIARVQALLENYGLVGWEQIFSYSVVDTSTIGNFLREAGAITIDKMSLENLAKGLQVDVSKYNFHTAIDDVNVTFECYFKMLDLMRNNYGKN